MAFTNITIVRKHLAEFRRPQKLVENLLFRLSGDEPLELPHKGIRIGTEKVKGKEFNQPQSETITIAANPVSLGHSNLVADSVVAASDRSLTKIYRENIDYLVDYSAGTVSRIEGGEIESGQEITVWYYHYRLYQKDSDYAISYASGKITRLPEGSLEDGQIVWVDYEIETGIFSDEMITRSVEEAHLIVHGCIAEEYLESSDSLLELAETYIALEILSRMKGLEVMQSTYVNPSVKSSLGKEYLELGQSYRSEADRILVRFGATSEGLNSGLKIRNNP
ncbi:MAG: hypothetical protein GF310_00070 [candidate division Zixibacteria bacterium]|nr:hypothetical protein [candidate division Zixibacteria bacterium]